MTAPAGPHLLGIDLGTTNTVGALGGRAVELGAAHVILPSVVAFPPSGARLVGAAARRRRVIDAENTIYSAKRVIGRTWDSPQAQEFRKRYPFVLEKGPRDDVIFATRGGKFSPVDIASMVVGTLIKNIPEAHRGRCAVAVPASFGAAQREATAEAVRQAGIPDVAVVEEPVAAAFAYAGRWKGSVAAVYDLGGGTFDFSLLDCSSVPFKVLGHDGDPFLGGDDVDFALADWAVLEVLRQWRVDLRADREAFDRLVNECEQAKIRLSFSQRTEVDLSQVDPVMLPPEARIPLDLLQLQKLVADLVRRTFSVCEDLIHRVGIERKDIGAVFLAGGSTQLPVVRSGLERFFGKPPHIEISPTQVVSIGTSLAALGVLDS